MLQLTHFQSEATFYGRFVTISTANEENKDIYDCVLCLFACVLELHTFKNDLNKLTCTFNNMWQLKTLKDLNQLNNPHVCHHFYKSYKVVTVYILNYIHVLVKPESTQHDATRCCSNTLNLCSSTL